MFNKKFIQFSIIAIVVVLLLTQREAIAAQVNKIIDSDTGTGGANDLPHFAPPSGGSSSTGNNTGNNTSGAALDYDKQLSSGSQGPEVAKLQELINSTGYNPPLATDGKFGIKTNNALKARTGQTTITLKAAYSILLSKISGGLF